MRDASVYTAVCTTGCTAVRTTVVGTIAWMVLAACSIHPAPTTSLAQGAAMSPNAECLAQRGLIGGYALSFVMQGSPVDMMLSVRCDPTGALGATTRSMGTRVDARRVTAGECTLHIELDPSVAGEGQIELTVVGDSATGTLTWQGQPTKISGKRLP